MRFANTFLQRTQQITAIALVLFVQAWVIYHVSSEHHVHHDAVPHEDHHHVHDFHHHGEEIVHGQDCHEHEQPHRSEDHPQTAVHLKKDPTYITPVLVVFCAVFGVLHHELEPQTWETPKDPAPQHQDLDPRCRPRAPPTPFIYT